MKASKGKLRDKDISDYLRYQPSHERFDAFLEIVFQLSPKQYWKFLREVWVECEAIDPNKLTWLRLLQSKKQNREFLMTRKEHKALEKLPKILRIWRGCGHKGGARGLSWTLEREQAEFFAGYAVGIRRRMWGIAHVGPDTNPIIVEAECKKSNVLAYFMERAESEIVVNPKHLTILKTIICPIK
jgi:hypothetical protein